MLQPLWCYYAQIWGTYGSHESIRSMNIFSQKGNIAYVTLKTLQNTILLICFATRNIWFSSWFEPSSILRTPNWTLGWVRAFWWTVNWTYGSVQDGSGLNQSSEPNFSITRCSYYARSNSKLFCSCKEVRDKFCSDGIACFFDATYNLEVIVVDAIWFLSVDFSFRHWHFLNSMIFTLANVTVFFAFGAEL